MRFGFFNQLPCPPGYSEQQRYQDILAQIELGDRVGFDTVWLGVGRVRELRRDYGMDEFICYFYQGGLMDPTLVRETMTLFAKEVMPHCR